MSFGNPMGNPLGNPLGLVGNSGPGDYARLLNDPVIVDFISSGGQSGTYTIPSGYKFYRVTAVGAGGAGISGIGGSGGGLAQTAILPVSGSVDISYSTAARHPASTSGQAASSSAWFSDRVLIGAGGTNSGGIPPLGGMGSGGNYNYRGGDGSNSGAGGGAAGPRGNGGRGSNNSLPPGDGVGGSGGGGGIYSNAQSGGGGGVGASGCPVFGVGVQRAGSSTGWGRTPIDANGGMWGGGGSGGTSSVGYGGEGGVRIELW